MIKPVDDRDILSYRVKLGHNRVEVRGRSREEAIREARSMFLEDMPRFWDVISSADDERFEVEEVN